MPDTGFTYTSVPTDPGAPPVIPLDYDFIPHAPCKILSILITSSGACAAENFTMTLDSGQGPAYDGVLYTKAMNGLTVWQYSWNGNADNVMVLDAGDVLTFAQANAGNDTLSLRIAWEKF